MKKKPIDETVDAIFAIYRKIDKGEIESEEEARKEIGKAINREIDGKIKVNINGEELEVSDLWINELIKDINKQGKAFAEKTGYIFKIEKGVSWSTIIPIFRIYETEEHEFERYRQELKKIEKKEKRKKLKCAPLCKAMMLFDPAWTYLTEEGMKKAADEKRERFDKYCAKKEGRKNDHI
jgi:hypothetical protein